VNQDQQKSYYRVLGISPTASLAEVRHAYRELSKLYHPDTTQLSPADATARFQRLNEAYSTLSNPEARSLYDFQRGYTRYLQPLPDPPVADKSAALNAPERPLSAGEIFALFILALTLIACLLLAVIVGMLRVD